MPNPELQQKVAAAFQNQLVPAMQASGLDLELAQVDSDGVVIVHLGGACQSCPSTAMSLVMEIERQLIELVPEVAYIEITAKR